MDARITILVCLMPFALGGCTGHIHSLIQDQSDRDIAVGTFRHEGPEGAAMVLEFRGVRFEAQGFAIERNQNLAELRQHRNRALRPDIFRNGYDHYLYSAHFLSCHGYDIAMLNNLANRRITFWVLPGALTNSIGSIQVEVWSMNRCKIGSSSWTLTRQWPAQATGGPPTSRSEPEPTGDKFEAKGDLEKALGIELAAVVSLSCKSSQRTSDFEVLGANDMYSFW